MGYHNPLLGLPEVQELLRTPARERLALAALLRGLRRSANDLAETAWARRKGPMAAYWRAVATYARHVAHALEKGVAAPAAAVCAMAHPGGRHDAVELSVLLDATGGVVVRVLGGDVPALARSVEFAAPSRGGASPRTHQALLALMSAIEQDAAADHARPDEADDEDVEDAEEVPG